MTSELGNILASVLTCVALTALASTQYDAWASRDITPVVRWRTLTVLQLLVGGAVGAGFHNQGIGVVVALTALGWLGCLSIATDLATHRVPWEPPHVIAAIGVVCFAVNWSTPGLLSLLTAALALVVIPLVARALTHNGLGLSDVRLLWAITATTAWWVGQTWLIFGLIIACLGQLVIRGLAPVFKWGKLVERRPSADPEAPQRFRRELPFAPAIFVGVIAAVALTFTSGLTACSTWSVTNGCNQQMQPVPLTPN